MSPRIEELKAQNLPPYGETYYYFIVDLSKSDEFDPNLFDEQARQVNFRSPEYQMVGFPQRYDNSRLKYIVRGDKMVIFRAGLQHSNADRLLPRRGRGRLQSAGDMLIIFQEESPRRLIQGYSETLEGRLPREKSEEYKFGIIKSELGSFFEIRG